MKDLETKDFFASFMKIRKVIPTLFIHSEINFTEFIALMHIKEKNPKNKLPHDLHINKSAVSQMLSSLEQKGFITRCANEHDRRKQDITVTQKGESIITELKIEHDMIIERISAEFGYDNINILIDLLDKLCIVIQNTATEISERKTEKL